MPHNTTTGKIYRQNGNGIIDPNDVAPIINCPSGDIGTLCTSDNIKIYAKYKPIRSNTLGILTDIERQNRRYGIRCNTNINRSLAVQDPYWHWEKPRGANYYDSETGTTVNEWYRLLDFDGYNHKAISPILPTSATFLSNGDLHVQLDKDHIVSTDNNAEIGLNEFNLYPNESYLGYALWDQTQKIGYYLTLSLRLSEMLYGTASQAFNKNIRDLPFENGDIIHFFYCLHTVCTETQEEIEFQEITAGVANSLDLMATDETHGHFSFTMVKFALTNNLKYESNDVNYTTINFGFDYYQYTFDAFGARLNIKNYTFHNQESYELDFRITCDDEVVATWSSIWVDESDGINGYVSLPAKQCNPKKSYSIEDDLTGYIAKIKLYVKFHSGSSWRYLVSFRYNILGGTFTYDYNNN